MKKNSCCECCGGNLKMLGNRYIKCEYCGQVYSVTEDGGSSVINVEDVYQDALKLKKTSNRENMKEAEKRLSRLRIEELEKINRQKKAQRNKKIAFYFVTILAGMTTCLLIAFFISTSYKKAREEKYITAFAAYEEENYEEALKIFEELKDYNDASKYVAEIRKLMEESRKVYEESKIWYEIKEYGKALEGFSSIRFYSDSETYIEQISDEIIQNARELFEREDYNKAKELIGLIPEDSEQYYTGIALGKEIEEAEKVAEEARQAAILLENYNKAIELYDASDYISAQSMFMELNGYEQSAEYLNKIGDILYDQAKVLYDAGDYVACAKGIKNIADSLEWVNYQLSNELLQRAKTDYTNKVNAEAKNILVSENYEAMCTYLKSMVCELYTSSDASVIIDEYKPVPLSSLDIFSKEYINPIGFEASVEDNVGNTHSNVLVGTNQLSYYISGKYATISGVGFAFKEFTNPNYNMKFVIYGDNMEELYYLELGAGEKPQEFCISIEGVEVLTIYLAAGGSFGGADEFAGIGELCLNKVP